MRRLYWMMLLFLAAIYSLVAQEKVHVVQGGQTLFSIAQEHRVSVDSIKQWNRLSTNVIYVGQKLVVEEPTQRLNTPQEDLSPPVLAPEVNSEKSPDSTFLKTYSVRRGDSLGLVAQNYKVSVNQLRAWNNLMGTELSPGQVLIVEEPAYLRLYEVKAGDTLYSVARENPVSFSELLALNGFSEDSVLRVGQKIRVGKPKETQNWHYVRQGDTIDSLAVLYNVSANQIKNLNSLGERISEGSLIKIREADVARLKEPDQASQKEEISVATQTPDLSVPVTPELSSSGGTEETSANTHTVVAGDTLYNIASRYGVLIDDLKTANTIAGNSIYKGQVLLLPQTTKEQETSLSKETKESPPSSSLPSAPMASALPVTAEVESNKPTKSNPPSLQPSSESRVGSLKSLVVLDPKIPLFEQNGDYYYWKHPKMTHQPSVTYFEQWNSPLDAYRKATQLLQAFDKLVDARPKKSDALKGKTIIIDPGHGGLDPGAIVKSKDGLGRDIYITEGQYVYDIALRMYVLLKDHGAQVKFTILAPDHLIRDTSPASNTLVNMKNQVYNAEVFNLNDTKESWPDGSQKGLSKRVEVIKSLSNGLVGENSIFISLHADNQPSMPRSMGLLYQKNAEMNDGYSQGAGETMQKVMGGEGKVYVKGQDLYVLRNNPMKYKLLIELRNVAWPEEAWALRFAEMRQEDAEKVVRGILAFFGS